MSSTPDSFLIKHNIRLDQFEEKMEAAVENLQESVQETHSMVEVHYEQSVNCQGRPQRSL